jgi:hypothetical protein
MEVAQYLDFLRTHIAKSRFAAYSFNISLLMLLPELEKEDNDIGSTQRVPFAPVSEPIHGNGSISA